MASAPVQFSYVALDGAGRRVRGTTLAPDEKTAFIRLQAEGFMPIRVKAVAGAESAASGPANLSDRDLAGLLSDLSALLAAGADIRAAFGIIGGKGATRTLQAFARSLAGDISGGDTMDRAFSRRLATRHAFVSALVSAGEIGGDLPGSLERGAEILRGRIAIRDQLVSVMSYPAFVLVTAIAAVLIILTLVVPAIAPLAETPGSDPGLALKTMLGLSEFLRSNALLLAAVAAGGVIALGVLAAGGQLARWGDRVFMDGPAARAAGQLAYGSFAIALGGILSAGAPMGDALRLSLRTVRSPTARSRLDPVASAVRQGETLSIALERVRGFPPSIARLTLIGEESGKLGPMLIRAGRLEEQAAIRWIEASSRILGPALIVFLGALIGLLMAALLSGVTGLGEAALA